MLIAIKKYKFYKPTIKLKKLSINSKKIKTVFNQQKPKNITELQLFLEFYNQCKRFIKYQLDKIKPFTRLTKKEEPQE